jgi:hypothetical protein
MGNGTSEQDLRQLEEFKLALAKKLENHKARLDCTKERRRLEHEKMLKLMGATLEYAQIAIRTVILSNTAAATAILAFLGNAMKDGKQTLHGTVTTQLGVAAFVFALGVAAGFTATIFAYLSQYHIVRIAIQTGGDVVPGTRWERTAGLLSVACGLGAFLVGVFLAAYAFSTAP